MAALRRLLRSWSVVQRCAIRGRPVPDPSQWGPWVLAWQGEPPPADAVLVALASRAEISVCGQSLQQWQSHLWLQRLPIAGLAQRPVQLNPQHPHRLVVLAGDDPSPRTASAHRCVALNLELPPPERAAHWRAHLGRQSLIWDPDPARVQLMLTLGLPARWLAPSFPANGWLERPEASEPQRWGQWLGLPLMEPGQLVVLGHGGDLWDRTLTAEARAATAATPAPIAYLPGWCELIADHPGAALAQAGWLAATARRAERLVWLGPEEPALAALGPLPVPPLRLKAPITPAELRAQVAGRPLMALAEDRPSPPADLLYSWQGQQQPEAAVLVSLFNYQNRIGEALASVARQRHIRLELVVVDDASTDAGAQVAEQWMAARVAQDTHPFARLALLRHHHNAGLATARNTAFAAAQADWCFVLDADNVLFPDALAACLAITCGCDPGLAVVHPLLAVAAESNRADDQRTLVSRAPWQRDVLRRGNTVDAMALIRRSAWQVVGGYTHIEAGWEDYDFWCKLIEAGFHGVQCPRVLAEYRSHASSMSHMATNQQWPALSRTLQRRHPWLQLPLA